MKKGTPDALDSQGSGSSRLPALLVADLRLRRRRWSGGGGGGGGGGQSINVLMVNNPQMLALQKHIGEFTKESGIKVNFTVKPENDMRNQAAQEFANQSGQFDVATLSNFEIPFYSKNGWLSSMDDIPAYKDDKDVQPGRHLPVDDRVVEGSGRQALRRAVLRRVVVPDVPQGRRRQGRA